MKIVLRIGGSILGAPPNAKMVRKYASVISRLVSEGNTVAVFVGGGPVSRNYMSLAKEAGLNHTQQDEIGIAVSRLNAKVIGMKLGIKGEVPVSVAEMIRRLRSSKVDVMGGTIPGRTVDTGAVLVAKEWKADLILKGSNQQGIYTADPRTHKDARKLERISHARMAEILGVKYRTGIHSIVDPVAVKSLVKSKIRLIVFDGTKPENVANAVHGKKVGTLVSSK